MSYIEIFGTLINASFGGINLSDYAFYCYDFKKPLMPQQKQTTADIPQRPGLIQLSKKFSGYYLDLYGFIQAASHSDLISKINALAGFLYSDTDKELILSNENDRYWNCQYLDYEEVDQFDDYTILKLSFTCNDPLAYAVTPDTDSQTITVLNSTFNLTNSGHYYTHPTFTITFNQAQTHVYIENQTIEDCRFDISGSFVTGDVLVVNCKTGVITLNGTEYYSGFGTGGDGTYEFIKLAFGDSANNLICVGTDDADINIDVDTEWEKTYLS